MLQIISGELPLPLIEKKARGCTVNLWQRKVLHLGGVVGFTLPDMSNLADDITKIRLTYCNLIGTVHILMPSNHSNLQCSGTIPDFSENTALVYLGLSENKLIGKSITVPSHRSKLVCSGTIPDFSKNLALKTLALYSNHLTGKSTMMSSHQSSRLSIMIVRSYS
jgi:hypothetical protein